MPVRLQLNLTPGEAASEEALKERCALGAGCGTDEISRIKILKLSLDARPKVPCWQASLEVYRVGEECEEPACDFGMLRSAGREVRTPCGAGSHRLSPKTVIVVGMGPAGLFAAMALTSAGVKVILLERGKKVEERRRDVGLLGREGVLDADSNYAYGEGGAGTFSDGKLYTRSNKRGDIGRVLRCFVHFGASPEILYQAHPHLGSDKMPAMVARMRQALLEAGCEIHFHTRVEKILRDKEGRFAAVVAQNGTEYKGEALVLATGNSAEDLYRYMDAEGWLLEEKPFALGVRLEHPQPLINHLQYKGAERNYKLPVAEYAFAEQCGGVSGAGSVGVFSFCMCPGGVVIPASTESDGLVVNGMSNSERSSKWANAGWVAAVNRELLKADGYKLGSGPLSLLDFRRDLERKFFEAGAKGAGCAAFAAPAQRMTDFVQEKLSRDIPRTSYSRGVFPAEMNRLLPRYVSEALRSAFLQVDKKKKGFLTGEAMLLGLESRTSSPVRIPRGEDMQHPEVKGLYPVGEGAGYAGGITSSAIDGLNCAERILANWGLDCNFGMSIDKTGHGSEA